MKALKISTVWVLAILMSSLQGQRTFEGIHITGKVVNATNNTPINGVNVVMKGSIQGTTTNVNGEYALDVISEKSVLIFSSLGYQTKEIRVGKRRQIDVSLNSDKPELADAETIMFEEMEMSMDLMASPPSNSKSSSRVMGAGGQHQLMSTGAIYRSDNTANLNTEEYDFIKETGFREATKNPLSTFSIDVDAASYSNLRRVINNGGQPSPDMVRIEELVNYFTYDYKNPEGEHPFSIATEVSQAPWNEKHQLVHIGLQGKKLDYENLKASNLVFLIDVSGSMSDVNKLPLLKSSMKLLVNELGPRDRIAIVAYAGAAGLVLPSTPASEKATIIAALDRLNSGGSTAGGAGIKLAYKVALENLIEDGNNRVILATDGDFNVGASSTSDMVRLIEEKRKSNIYLTITGFGMGNYKDGRMEQISNAGNGNYFYIDNIKEARKVFVTEMRANLFTIAKDVKIQVEFNPAHVQAYRLIGYENRMLNAEDFNDDKKDAGELGAGHTVTALYEIIPTSIQSSFLKNIDALKYQQNDIRKISNSNDLLTVKFRYKKPKEENSKLITQVLQNVATDINETSNDFRWAAAVAEYGQLLRDSEFKGQASYGQVLTLAIGAKGNDTEGYRAEFIDMVRSSQLLAEK
ncbi:MAG: von Willebrand factor type A domain-containing protein [Bacteroidetes bacterium]|nr:von Willebrand factor type A domain-containing protein [Bacteroidota bacterium]MDA1121044.1 von Willebrand factor type A domain-containing protein [Bacteroidota bacterium]